MFGKDRDERFHDYLSEGSMFGKMDKDEWDRIENQAEEIASGLVLGTFQRDERVWDRVREIKEESGHCEPAATPALPGWWAAGWPTK